MTENKKHLVNNKTGLSVKRFSCLLFASGFLTLSGCSGFNFPNFGSSQSKADTALEKEISYIEEKRSDAVENAKNLFGRSLRSDGERINRLERAVQSMRNDFDTIQPSIRRLTALESEIQTLIGELRTLNNGGTAPDMAMQSKPRPAQSSTYRAPVQIASSYNNTTPKPSYSAPPKTTYQKKTPPPASGGQATIYDLRVGEHPGRTRIVMDSNIKTAFSIDVDNAENIAVIDLPNTKWSARTSQSLARSSFVSSYSVEPSGSGHIVVLKLKRNAKVTYKDDLKGTTGNSRRFVIDLSGA